MQFDSGSTTTKQRPKLAVGIATVNSRNAVPESKRMKPVTRSDVLRAFARYQGTGARTLYARKMANWRQNY